jgi:hypothetical protein
VALVAFGIKLQIQQLSRPIDASLLSVTQSYDKLRLRFRNCEGIMALMLRPRRSQTQEEAASLHKGNER